MRRIASAFLMFLLSGTFVNPALGQDTAQETLEQAIQAHGGEQVLSKYKAGQSKTTGILKLGPALEFTQQAAYMLPDKIKEVQEVDLNGRHITVHVGLNGAKDWYIVNGEPVKDDRLMAELKESANLLRAIRLVPLKDGMYRLTPLAEKKVNQQPAVGIRVSAKGLRDIDLYFDKATHRLAKVERQALNAITHEEVGEERIYGDYEVMQGIQTPKKVTVMREHRTFLEANIVEMKYLEKLEDTVFTPPPIEKKEVQKKP